jgi:glycosyltransferase involved in cell wall biosynthesis
MADLMAKRLHDGTRRLRVIPNWADVGSVQPIPREGNPLLQHLGLQKKFVVQYSGNMGRTHGLEGILDAAMQLREEPDIQFVLIGDGAKRHWAEEQAARRSLANVTILPWQPRETIAISLNACDLALVSFVKGMAGVSVPSRMYNIMAAGKPILAVADENSELARVVKEEELGWVVTPEMPDQLVAAIRLAKADPGLRASMGKRARAAAEDRHALRMAIDGYLDVIREVAPGSLMKES